MPERIEVHEVTKRLTALARQLGWDMEWNSRDHDGDEHSYDAYLWPIGTDGVGGE